MKKLIISCFLVCFCFLCVAQEYYKDQEIEIFQLINQSKSFELLEKYNEYKSTLSPFVSLFVKMTLSMHFNRDEDVVCFIDSLLDNYSSRLSSGNIAGLQGNKVDLLFKMGRYKDVYHYCQKILKEYNDDTPEDNLAFLSNYEKLGKKLYNYSSPVLHRPDSNCYVSIKPYRNSEAHNFISITADINNHEVEDCVFDTGAWLSFFSEEDAQKANVKIIDDTIITYHPQYGTVKYRYGIVDSLRIGNAILTNVLIGVVCPSSVFLNIIGLKEMKIFGKLIFTPHRIIFPDKPLSKADIEPNICIRSTNIFLRCIEGRRKLDFFFDSGQIGNLIDNTYFPPDTLHPTWNDFALTLRDSSYVFPFAIQAENNKYFSGILGTSFIRSFRQMVLDLNNMQIEVDSFVRHVPLDKYLIIPDFFAIEKIDEIQGFQGYNKYFFKLVNYWGKNRPNVTNLYFDTLINNYYKDIYPTFQSVLPIRIESLFNSGYYKEAYKEAENFIDKYPQKSLKVQEYLQKSKALSSSPPMEIFFKDSQKTFKLSKQSKKEMIIPVRVNNKKEKAIINIGIQECLIPTHLVSKLNIEILSDSILFNEQCVKLGLINRLVLGNIIADNLVCYILPEENSHITLGMSLLKFIPQIGIVPGRELTFYEKKKGHTFADSLCMRLQKSILMTQFHFNGESVTFAINDNDELVLNKNIKNEDRLYLGKYNLPLSEVHSHKINPQYLNIQGEIGFSVLMEKNIPLLFDFEKMKIYFFD